MDADSRDRTLEDLRTIVEKVERKTHVPLENPDLVALREIVEQRITELESGEDTNPWSSDAA
jgi:hypothetical protein